MRLHVLLGRVGWIIRAIEKGYADAVACTFRADTYAYSFVMPELKVFAQAFFKKLGRGVGIAIPTKHD